ncbi:MAG: Rpn family recombination-promoting nuclease/putative transposase [Rickettsiaceae bacterium]|nr:Rpn family recombination-promoting nuclease/putative transposase [Rickettsiaceae bacterium]
MTKNSKQKEKTNSENLSHDGFFKSTLAKQEIAVDFLRTHLPENVVSNLDFNTLSMQQDSFVEESLERKMVDVLFKCSTLKGEDSYVYLLVEHQSSSDYWISWRLLCYKMAILDRWRKENPLKKKLPMVYNIVLYNGRAKYRASLDLSELFANPEQAKNMLLGYKLVNLTSMADEEITKHKWAAVLEFFMKHAFVKDFLSTLKTVEKLLQDLGNKNSSLIEEVLANILWYNINKIEVDEQNKIKETLKSILKNQHKAEDMMGSLVKKWFNDGLQKGREDGRREGREDGRREGMQKGREDGRREGREDGRREGMHKNNLLVAKNMLKQNLSKELIMKITGLSLEEIDKL